MRFPKWWSDRALPCFLSAELTPWPKPRGGRSSLYAEARGGAGAAESGASRCPARLVRPPAPPPAVARAARRDARSLPRLAQRDHAAADDGRGGACRISSVSCAAGPTCARSARAELDEVLARLGRARLLRARPQPACLRARGGAASTAGSFPDDEAGLRALPGIGAYTAAAIAAIAFGQRATAGRRQCRAGDRAALRGRGRRCPQREARDQALAETLTPDDAAGRLRPGDDGSRRDDLHAAPRRPAASVRGASRLPGRMPSGMRRGAAFPRRRRRERPAAPRRGLRRRQRGRRGAAARATAAGPARRHDRDAVIAVERGRFDGDSHAIRAARRPIGASCPAWSSTASRIFSCELTVFAARGRRMRAERAATRRCRWVEPRDSTAPALPTVMRKVLRARARSKASRRSGPAAR